MLDQVVGNENSIRLLRSHLEAPQPSYIFHGTNGVGKKYSATQMFLELVCTGDRTPTCECNSCRQVASNTHPDLRYLVPEGASYGIGQVQDITDDARTYPTVAPYKFLIFEDAGTLTANAANSLLKILEDGTPKVVFIFVLEDEDDLLPTIQSRSVSVKFSTLSLATMLDFLGRYDSDTAKVRLCANLADGSISSALKYLRDGGLAERDEALTFIRELSRTPFHRVIDGIDKCLEKGQRPETLFYLLRHILADVLLLSSGLGGRVANFDKLEDLQRSRKNLGDDTVVFAVEELNRLYMKMPLIKGTFPIHLKTAFLKVRRSIRAPNPR